MNLTENFESVKKFAVDAAQTATQKAKILAAVAKANVSIYAEEDKIRKAEAQLGKLYYRDYAVGEEMDTAELKDYIDDVKADNETPSEAPAASAEDFADAQPEQEQTASEEAPCACTETPCCEQAAPEAPAETPEIKIEVVDGEDKAE